MSHLRPTKDNRTTYDEKTGAVRSFFGTELVTPISDAKRGFSSMAKADDFITVNSDLFKLKNITLDRAEEREGAASSSLRYVQSHHGIPVYHASLVIGQRKDDGSVSSVMNSVDYDLPKALGPDQVKLSAEQVLANLHERFDSQFEHITLADPVLYIYRHKAPSEPDPHRSHRPIRDTMLALATGKANTVYLAWQVLMDTREPSGEWKLMLDAVDGTLIAVEDRRLDATRKGLVFWPDPVRSKKDDSLSWSTAEATLNNECVEVEIQNLDAPVNNKYKLNGTWIESIDYQSPTFTPPETTTDFKFGSKTDGFLSVMAYYYLDRLITDLRGLGCTQFNSATTKVKVDAQGYTIDNSSSTQDSNGNLIILLGKGGVPDAADPAVVVHEYGHSIYRLMGISSSSPYSYEQGWCDLLAACWLDRFNDHLYQREEVFAWDNCPAVHWDATRRLDRTERFNDPGFSSYGHDLKGSIFATALWDWYLNIGGNSENSGVRKWAADEVIRTYLDMLVVLDSHEDQKEDYKKLGNALMAADVNRTGGLYKKVIWDAFRRRGAWSDFTPAGNVDLYVRDSETDTGEHASPQVHWTSPDIWVRNNPPPADPSDPSDPNHGEDPEAGHQNPINEAPNYLYVRVRNRGSQDAAANAFTVEAFHCNPATAMQWPGDFNPMGTLSLDQPVPANGGSARVGPFIWTPSVAGHECLLAVVKGANDQTIADDVKAKGAVDHWKLVRFDNNVGQRNVTPVPATPGGKTQTSFLIRGTSHSSNNTLCLDATPLPDDTKISIRVARSITDTAKSMSGFTVREQNNRWTTLALAGGKAGSLVDFPLATNEERSVHLEIDFSYKAKHLQRYPVVASQEQDGIIAGRLTLEIIAVKESEDYVYGNTNTLELHVLNCKYRKMISPHHQVPFQTIKDALARGFNGCRYCLPEHNTD